MASAYTPPVQALIDELGRLPGIGPEVGAADRLPPAQGARRTTPTGSPTRSARRRRRCASASAASTSPTRALCPICADDRRDPTIVCVVEESRDIVAIERTGEFRGRYHVLLGAMSPLEGHRTRAAQDPRAAHAGSVPEGIQEVIVCTNPNTEGEVTAMYLARMLKPLGLKVTRIASGLPVGGDLEYADELTLGRALEGRRTIDA